MTNSRKDPFDQRLWDAAETVWATICSDGPSYRSPPEVLTDRHAVIGDIKTILQDDRLDARAVELRYLPGGWATLLRDGLRALLHAVSQVPGQRVTILVCKEKAGELRLVIQKTGDDDLDREIGMISDWVTGQSRERCAVTGQTGQMTFDGWIIPLTAEFAGLKRSDPAAFRKAVAMF